MVSTLVVVEAKVALQGGIELPELRSLYERGLPEGLLLVDTRQDWEFRSGHIAGAALYSMEPTWWARLRSKGKLSEADIDAALREVRLALLEADVNVGVARNMLGRIKDRALEADVQKSLSPGQQVIKIVHEELTTLLGGEAPKLDLSGRPPVALMLVGLQGSGKTTTAAKLAKRRARSAKSATRRRRKLPASVVAQSARKKKRKIVKVAALRKNPGKPVRSQSAARKGVGKKSVKAGRKFSKMTAVKQRSASTAGTAKKARPVARKFWRTWQHRVGRGGDS